MTSKLDETRASWNVATRAHNAHKRDQAGWLRRPETTTLFPEELELLGDVAGKRLLHTLCNSGQDTLSLAKRGAVVTGVDLSDVAVEFAQTLSKDAGIPATFVHSEAIAYLEAAASSEATQFDVVFGSYGCLPWIADLRRFFRGVARVLVPGGRAVFVEFHPAAWSLHGDPYVAPGHDFAAPVNDYVGESKGALSPSGHIDTIDVDGGGGGGEGGAYVNPHSAHAVQHTVGDVVQAVIDAGLVVTQLREWDYANGCKLHPSLELVDGNRYRHTPSWPLMLGVAARK